MDKLLNYKYYDSPEGEDVIYKTIAISKFGAVAGLGYGVFDVLMYSRTKGFVNTAGRLGWYVGPLVGAAAAFAVTANVTQNIRGKNDKLNYFLGGAVSGLILSAWQRVPVMAVPLAMIFGTAAMIKKTALEEGHTFFPDFPQATKTIKSAKHDWTLAKDLPQHKNWTSG